jgi:hypothetical protein
MNEAPVAGARIANHEQARHEPSTQDSECDSKRPWKGLPVVAKHGPSIGARPKDVETSENENVG